MADSTARHGCVALSAALFLVLSTMTVHAEGFPKLSMYLEAGPHLEGRAGVGQDVGFDATACIGYLVWDWFDLYVGLRAGLMGETVASFGQGTSIRPYFPIVAGAEAYFLLPTAVSKVLVWTCGVTTDTLFYTDADHLDPADYEPAYWYVGVFLGLRWYVTRNLHVEAKAAGGTLPLFRDATAFAGARLSVGLDF